jgi:hypothetical protein
MRKPKQQLQPLTKLKWMEKRLLLKKPTIVKNVRAVQAKEVVADTKAEAVAAVVVTRAEAAAVAVATSVVMTTVAVAVAETITVAVAVAETVEAAAVETVGKQKRKKSEKSHQ